MASPFRFQMELHPQQKESMTKFSLSRRAMSGILAVGLLLILVLGTACGGGSRSGSGGSGNGGGGNSNPPPPPPASSVTLTPPSATIFAGQTVTFNAQVNGTTDQTVTWSVNGIVGGNSTVGTISVAGGYQSPSAMPNPNQVTIQAVSVTNSNATASSSVTINNAIPHISTVTPDSFQSPASFTLTINGSGFASGAVANWDSTVLPTQFVSPTQLTISGNQSTLTKFVTLSVTNPDPGGIRSNQFLIVTDPDHLVTPSVAARYLQQSSWGPTDYDITSLRIRGINAYLAFQLGPQTTNCYPAPGKDDSIASVQQRFFICAVSRDDQLRQRVAFALSQIMVVSANKVNTTDAFTLWQNMLMKDAFGNFYDLLKDVTLSPVMGNYLDMVNNDKPNSATGTSANENYAREVLQLFSIGLNQLNPDGTLQLDSSGNPIPTYTQDTITSFARVFTGWTYPPGSSFPSPPGYSGPMVPFNNYHDTGDKTLLNGFVIPAGGTAQSDLDAALQNIFNHPNVGPFICKQLIQHLVTSNPSPAYVARVVAAFNDNGSGVRGDLKAVVSAILLDPEARRGDDPTQVEPGDGHLKEPILLMTNLLRTMNAATGGDGLSDYAADMFQEPLNPPTVFNFYPPDYSIPNTNLLGPEFQIFNSSTAITRVNFVNDAIYGRIGNMTTDLTPYLPYASSPDQLVDKLGTVMMHGEMSPEMRSTIITAISGITDNTKRVKAVLYLIASSSQYQVEH
jgi:uncharacterized protein (DUF1800 family)